MEDSDFLSCPPILPAMLRTSRFSTAQFRDDRGLRFLARSNRYKLDPELVRQLTAAMEGFTGRRDEVAPRAGIEWRRACYRNTRGPAVAP
jgi:hypothetical protein